MKEEINLTLKTASEKKKTSRMITISVAVFVAIFVVAAFVMVYSLYLSSQTTTFQRQVTDLQSQISSHSEQKTKLLALNERLGGVRSIIASRKDIDKNMSVILDSVPQNFRIDAIKADDITVSVNLSSANLADYDDLLEENIPKLVDSKPKGLKRIEVGNFSRSSSGYTLTLIFYFGEKPKS